MGAVIDAYAERHLTQRDGEGGCFGDVTVVEMRGSERRDSNVLFVRPKTPVDDLLNFFITRLRLETVLITAKGEPVGQPLGIVTRGDAVRLLDESSEEKRTGR